MKQYKLISSTNPNLPVGMILPLDLKDLSINDKVSFLGEDCVCTQDTNIITLVREANDDLGNVYSLQEVPSEKNEQSGPHKIDKSNFQELRINKEIDIFFDTKQIMISPTENISRAHGITVEAFFKFLQKEWFLLTDICVFPLELEENNNLVLWDEWNLTPGSFEFLKEGSWTRKKALANGRIQIL